MRAFFLIVVGVLAASCTTDRDRHAGHQEASRELASIIPSTPMRVLAYFRCPDASVVRTVNTAELTELSFPDGRQVDLPATGDRLYSDGSTSVRFLRPIVSHRVV